MIYAKIADGAVINLLVMEEALAQGDSSLVAVGDLPTLLNDIPVRLGDAYTDGKFYHNGTRIDTPLEKMNADMEDVRATVEWLRAAVNVKAFGAKGDGETDDTASIQACFDALEDGDSVFFPDGTYLVTGIALAEKNSIRIHGQNASLKLKAETNASPLTLTRCAYCRINSLEMDGNQANQTAVIDPGDDYRNGLSLYGTYFTQISDCRIHDAKKHGVVLKGFFIESTFYGCDECHILDNYIQQNGKTGLLIDSVSDLNISGNNIEFNGESGCWIGTTESVGSGNNNIVNNNFLTNDKYGLELSDCARTLLANNHIRNNGERGMYIHGGKEITLMGNNVHLNGRLVAYSAGIVVAYMSHVILQGNLMTCTDFDATQGYGLEGYSVTGLRVIGNICRNNLNADMYADSCSDVIAALNMGIADAP